jgi:hypothetical protein
VGVADRSAVLGSILGTEDGSSYRYDHGGLLPDAPHLP